MLRNNLHPDVAENPAELVVYGGIGKAARNWSCYHTIERELRRLGGDETLLVQSGKPVAVFETHERAPRVLIANSNLVPQWATWEQFRELDAAGLDDVRPDDRRLVDLHRQPGDPAGHLRDVRRRRAQTLRRHARGPVGGHRRARWDGRRAAARDHDARRRGALRRGRHIPDRAAHQTGYLDERASDLDDALTRLGGRAPSAGRCRSASPATPPRSCPSSSAAGVEVDVVTDQTSAHDPLNGYVPVGLTVEQADGAATLGPRRVSAAGRRERARARRRDPRACGRPDARRSITATRCADSRSRTATRDAFSYPGFVPAYIRPLFCEGKGPFRWVALSGDPADIHATDRAILDLFGDQEHIARWIKLASERVQFQGLPARICWLGYGEREKAGARFNEMVASGELQGPDRDRPRPPRRRLGRVARARDRGDARRLRRRRRLAAPQRDVDDRLRRQLGLDPPRRRRRDGQVDPRRPGRRRRRHRVGGRAGPAHADRRPGTRHRPPRRRRLHGGA